MSQENNRGIYMIFNTINDKCYVGSTKDAFRKRWKNHRLALATDRHHSFKLQKSYAKYGESAFIYVVLEIVVDEANLVEREQFWIDKLNSVTGGYNVAPKASSTLGLKWNEESRQKMVEIRAANPISPEQHALMAEARRNSLKCRAALAKVHQANIGRRQTDDAKVAIGEASRNRWLDPERKANHSALMTGYKHTDEAREKISKSRAGMTFTEAHKRNLSVAHLAYEPTQEARKNMSLSQQRRRERERERERERVERDVLSPENKLLTGK